MRGQNRDNPKSRNSSVESVIHLANQKSHPMNCAYVMGAGAEGVVRFVD